MIGTTVSHYEVLDKLGEGGMGVVYRARDVRLGRMVALKFLPPGLALSEEARARFMKEACAASALNHPNVAIVYDVGDAGTGSFIAMELLDGETLRARLGRERLSPREVVHLGAQIADGLQAAHAKGIVHRDVKPENLLLTHAGTVKIMDFGIAKLADDQLHLTRTGTTLGTLAYMSPEQLLADEVDHRADLWSLGVVLYEMLAGAPPFQRDRDAAVLYEILNAEMPPLQPRCADVPAPLEALIRRLLHKDPAKRPATATDVGAELRASTSAVHAADRAPAQATPSQAVPSATVPGKSIAVLYFENMSSDRESDYVCAGITEDIITDLSKVRDLRVVSRTDMLPFRNKEVNIRQVGEALHVNYVLEGSVRKSGNRVRITAQLISAQDGFHLWADRFDGLIDDIFDVQNEVARKIAEALKISLSSSEEALLAKKPTDDVRAYDLYMRGREFLSRRGRRNTESAIRMFEAALEIDPRFAAAHAGLGEACAYMYEWYDGATAWLARAIASDEAALERDPTSVDARFGIAMVYYHQGRFAESKRALEGVLESQPRHVDACLRLGMLEERLPGGDLHVARTRYLAAAELRPHDDEPWRNLAALNRKLGDADAAREAALRVIELTTARLEASLDDTVLLARLAEAYARFGGVVETHATLRSVLESDPTDGMVLYHCAAAHALLGEEGPALMLLQRAFDHGFRGVILAVRNDGAFAGLSAHPDYLRLLARLDTQ